MTNYEGPLWVLIENGRVDSFYTSLVGAKCAIDMISERCERTFHVHKISNASLSWDTINLVKDYGLWQEAEEQ